MHLSLPSVSECVPEMLQEFNNSIRFRWREGGGGGGGGVAQHKGLQLNNCLFFFSINSLYYHFLFVVVTQIRSRIHKYIKSKSYSE